MNKLTALAALLMLLVMAGGLTADPLFGTAAYYEGCGWKPIFAADLDGDSDVDMVTGTMCGELRFYWNDGSGSFAPTECPGCSDVCYELASVFGADLDGDGDVDLAAGEWRGVVVGELCRFGFGVTIYLNDGSGYFMPGSTYDLNVPYSGFMLPPRSVFSADLDDDNDYDLAVTVSENVCVLFNNGDGTFQPAVSYAVGSDAADVFSADFNGDNMSDLAVAGGNSDNVFVLLNNGDGSFAGAVQYSVGVNNMAVFCEDFDGDTDKDIVAANHGSDNIAILSNNGDGTFSDAVFYAVGDGPGSVYSADFDDDAHFDLAVLNELSDDVSVLLNDGTGSFSAPLNHSVSTYSLSVISADLDGDNDNDLAVQGPDTVTILFNTPICCQLRGDFNQNAQVDILDVDDFIDWLFRGGAEPACREAADVDDNDQEDILDIDYMIDWLYRGGPDPVPCP